MTEQERGIVAELMEALRLTVDLDATSVRLGEAFNAAHQMLTECNAPKERRTLVREVVETAYDGKSTRRLERLDVVIESNGVIPDGEGSSYVCTSSWTLIPKEASASLAG